MACADRFAWLWVVLAVWAVGGIASAARADDLADFENARAAYDGQDHQAAVQAFEALVGGSPPRLTDRLLVLESRKYLGASLLFVGQVERAREQFRLLVREEPDYVLDPLAFPTEVITIFDQVKSEVAAELEQAVRAEQERLAEQMRAHQQAERERREKLSRLVGIAETERVQLQNSRWVATIPFGVGQFQNNHGGLGSALAVAEGVAAATSILTFLQHQRLRSESPSPDQVSDARRREELWRTANIASFAIFVGLAVIGVVDAHVRFLPERATSRPRPLPEDLDTWLEQEVSVRDAPPSSP